MGRLTSHNFFGSFSHGINTAHLVPLAFPNFRAIVKTKGAKLLELCFVLQNLFSLNKIEDLGYSPVKIKKGRPRDPSSIAEKKAVE